MAGHTRNCIVNPLDGKQPIEDSIAVLPEIHKDNLDVCKGICSDYIENYK